MAHDAERGLAPAAAGRIGGAPPASPVISPSDQAAEIARLRRELDRARMERDVLEKSDRHLREDAQVAFAFIEQHARTWPVRLMCRVLAVSPSGYYSWRSRPKSAWLASNRQLLDDVRRIHAEHHGRYVAPRVHTALRAEGRAALPALHDRQPSRLAGRAEPPEAGFLGLATRHSLAGGYHLSIPTGEGWLYLATVLDLATHKIVGWSMRDHMRSELTVAALMMARQRQRWATRDETKRDLSAYLEGYYSRRRIHSALGYITPEQAERNAN